MSYITDMQHRKTAITPGDADLFGVLAILTLIFIEEVRQPLYRIVHSLKFYKYFWYEKGSERLRNRSFWWCFIRMYPCQKYGLNVQKNIRSSYYSRRGLLNFEALCSETTVLEPHSQ